MTRGSGSPELWGSGSPRLRGSEALGLRVSGAPRLRSSEAPELRGSGAPRLRGSGSPGLRGSEAPGLRVSEAPELRGSGALRLRVSGSPGLRGSGSPRLWGSGSPRLWGSGALGLRGSGAVYLRTAVQLVQTQLPRLTGSLDVDGSRHHCCRENSTKRPGFTSGWPFAWTPRSCVSSLCWSCHLQSVGLQQRGHVSTRRFVLQHRQLVEQLVEQLVQHPELGLVSSGSLWSPVTSSELLHSKVRGGDGQLTGGDATSSRDTDTQPPPANSAINQHNSTQRLLTAARGRLRSPSVSL